jgi:hypothetical protein
MREVLAATKKKGEVLGTTRAKKKHSCPQYDSFMGIGRGTEELLEMLLSALTTPPFFLEQSAES